MPETGIGYRLRWHEFGHAMKTAANGEGEFFDASGLCSSGEVKTLRGQLHVFSATRTRSPSDPWRSLPRLERRLLSTGETALQQPPRRGRDH